MIRRFTAFVLSVLAIISASAAEPHQSVGLVLSGGGSKGIAHIGVIQALEDNDIPIDYVTGTSMGAIVGALYCMGYTPDEMLDLILSKDFSYWSTGQIDPALTYYFNREPVSPVMLHIPIKTGKEKTNVPASLISPLPMNFGFLDIFAPYTAACHSDFDRLMVPFRCVASDVAAHRMQVLSRGSLGDAVRASMSFPIVFQPTRIGDDLLYDGGIYDNFPVDVMRRDFAPSIMFGVTVNTPDSADAYSLMDQLDNLVIQRVDYNLPPEEGIKLHIDLREFGLLDFPNARQIYRIGYDHAMAMMDSLKTRITARTPRRVRELRRAVFRSQVPYTRFGSVEVTGGTERQNEYIRYLFNPRHGSDTIGIDRAREAYYRAISSGKLADLGISTTYCDSTGLFDLRLRAAVKSRLRLGVGGYITSTTNSFLYASLGYSSLSFRSIDASLSGWLGQSVMAGMANARVYMHTPFASAIDVEAVASRTRFYQGERLFFDDKNPTFVIDHQFYARAGWSVATGRTGQISALAGYGWLRNSFYSDLPVAGDAQRRRDRSQYSLAQALVRYTSETLDQTGYPTSGHSYTFTAMGVTGRHHLRTADADIASHPRWLQGEIRTRNYFETGAHFSLGVESDILLSTRKLLATYSATLADAPQYTPTPSSASAFVGSLRSNSFIAAGLVPVYRYNENLSARVGAYGFLPLRQICGNTVDDRVTYGKWLRNPQLWTEAAIAYKFPVGTLAGYVNYSTAAGDKWHVGLSLGIFILPPKFLR